MRTSKSKTRGRKAISDIVANLLLIMVVVAFSYVVISMFLRVMTLGSESVVEQGRGSLTLLRQVVSVLACYIGGDNNLTIIITTGPDPVVLYGVIYDSNSSQQIYINDVPTTISSNGVLLNASSIYVLKIPVNPSVTELDVMIVYGGGVYEVTAKRV